MTQEIMQYIYGALWLVVSALLIFRFTRESKWFYLAGGWFAIFGALTIVDEVLNRTLLVGVLRWIFQGATGVVAVILIIVFLTEGKRSRSKHGPKPLEPQDDSPYDDDFDRSQQEEPVRQSGPYDPTYEPSDSDPYRGNDSYNGYDPYDGSESYRSNEPYGDSDPYGRQ